MDITTFRNEFPVIRHWAFLDHAAVAPLPAPAVKALGEYATDLARNGITALSRWRERARVVRSATAQLLNADSREIAFIKNTSEGLGFVAEGLPWKGGDQVVIAAEEYPSNQYPWLNLRHRGVEVVAVPSRGNRILIDDLSAAITQRTRVVSLSFVEYASGYRNDLTAIGTLCRERGIYFCVDAIQGLGALPLDVRQTPIDFLAADSHKWLLGPEGIGVFFIRRELMEMLHPIGVGWHSVVNESDFQNIRLEFKPSAERWEGGAANFAGISAFGASLELLLKVGVGAIAGRVKALTDHLCSHAASAGLEVFSSRDANDWSGIVSLQSPRHDPQVLKRRCREAGIVVNVRAGRIRVSPHAYNTEEEIDRFLECIRTHGTP